ncbi:MAG: glycoside hydrolase family 3 C-terminal domain-containing protein [Bacteroides sp.]|nr:glycoside hydrolase family 3 C-terminal domain-containing protein [Bacteroides sp.]
MRKSAFILLTILTFCLSGCNTSPSTDSFRLKATDKPLSDAKTEAMVNALYEKMSQPERIAQLHGIYAAALLDKQGRVDTAKCRQLIPYGIGHFSQYASTSIASPDSLRNMVAELQHWLTHHTPNKIPALFHEEVISGIAAADATVYPQQLGIACSFNLELATEKTRQTAKAMRQIGGLMALSPMTDVVRNPHFNRLEESYGEDAYLSAAMGVAFVNGLQDGGLDKGIAACSKHFLGYGGGSESSGKELMEEILLPHEAMIRVAGSKVVMTGYHLFHGTKAVANPELGENILRRYLKYDGIMVSDYGSVSQIDDEMDAVHRAAAAINAGNDVEFPMGLNYSHLQTAIDEGLVSPATLEKAVKRVLTLKVRLGMFDGETPLYGTGNITFDTPEERETAYQLAAQSVVLLKNNGILPLTSPMKIALTGPNANTMWAMLGDYTYQGMSFFWHRRNPSDCHPKIVTLKEGLETKLPKGVTLDYARGCDWTEKNEETTIEETGDERARMLRYFLGRRIETGEEVNLEKAVELAAGSDVIIAAVGENTMLCGENRDRSSLRLPGSQEAFVRRLIDTGKPVVLIMFGGRAQVIGDIAEKCAAVLQAWYPGEEGGNAVADILYGNVSPSGKLCLSYPAVELNENICYNYSCEQDERVAYPFGFGLSYTHFSYSQLNIDKASSTSAESIRVRFAVTNTGKVAADEIVQLYLSPTSDAQPLKPIQLQGFGRISLEPGQTRTVEFLLSPQQFGHYNNGQWTVDAGNYQIKIGASSTDIRLSDTITLNGESYTIPLRTVYFSEIQNAF